MPKKGFFICLLGMIALTLVYYGFINIHAAVLENTSKIVALDDTKSASISVFMLKGNIDIDGSSDNLMEGQFNNSLSKWQPNVELMKNSDRTKLIIEQPANSPVFFNNKIPNDWMLKFNNEIPMDMHIFLGTGNSKLKLSGLNLSILEIISGNNNMNLNLTGTWKRNAKINLTFGTGEATIILPKNIGVIADVKGGLGKIYADSLEMNGSSYVNAAYGKSDITISLKIINGSSKIHFAIEK